MPTIVFIRSYALSASMYLLPMNHSCIFLCHYLMQWKGKYVSLLGDLCLNLFVLLLYLFYIQNTILLNFAGLTYVPLEAEPVIKILLTLNKQDKVRHLRDAIISLRVKEGHILDEGVTIVLAEVLDHHIAKFLVRNCCYVIFLILIAFTLLNPCLASRNLQDDATPLRYVNDTNRTIYALEVIPPPAWYKTSKPSSQCMELIDVPDPLEESDLPVLVNIQNISFTLSFFELSKSVR